MGMTSDAPLTDPRPQTIRGRRWWPGPVLGAAAGLVAIGTVVLAATAFTSAGASTTTPSPCAGDSPKLTVQGTGKATGTPDIATVDVDVSTVGPTAQAALQDNDQRTAAVVTAFTAGGVASSDIQTTNVSVQPNYAQSPTTGVQTITGYQVDDTVTATIHNISTAGATLDAVSAAAGDAGQINSVSFSVQDTRSLEDHARTDAVQQAVSHAQAMAAWAGSTLGPVCSVTDSAPAPEPVPLETRAGAAAQGAPSVPLQPGTQEVDAQVTVVYALQAA